MKFIRFISRVLVGLVFIFSGFVKGVDHIGSSYKFHDYFSAFGMDFLQGLALPLAIVLCGAEFLIGVALVLGIRMKVASWSLLLFMVFFTILTFILAVFNPVSDCGCFGDAVKLTNWGTFLKNVVLMVFTLVIFFSRKKYNSSLGPMAEWITVIAVAVAFGAIMDQSLRHLPMIDFRPYKIGTDIVRSMQFPPNAPRDSFDTHLFYKKDGVVKEFTMANYPWQDSTWKWVETKVVLVKAGYKPPVHDFSIKTIDDRDITDSVLHDQGFSFLLISPDIRKANRNAFARANAIAQYCASGKARFYALTASSQSEIDSLQKQFELSYEFYHTDETTLKTISRANPGLMLIRDGVVLGQWHYNDFPAPEKMGGNLEAFAMEQEAYRAVHRLTIMLVLGLFLGIAVFHIFKMYVKSGNTSATE